MPLVTTKLGKVQGKIALSADGSRFFAFHGIPYAQPPIGALRFKAPQPAESWSGVLDATKESDECYSKHQFYLNTIGSEDCLKLNVYTRSVEDNKQSVMVFIHGGGFVAGSSRVEVYGPDYFMNENILLVTMNYRLGIFGFLALEDKSLGVPGNAGLKDQIMALRWIQENIHFFGGDPENVTVFGNSAGSASINYLLCSEMARGLFHRAIMQSGSALNPWARGKGLPAEILNYLGVEVANDRQILEKLMNCTKEELLDAQNYCHSACGASELEAFGPTVEGVNAFEPSLLLEDPLKIMQCGNFIKIPMIIGYNSGEGLLFDAMETKYNVDLTVRDFRTAIPWFYKTVSPEIATKIKEFYFGNSDPTLRKNRNQYCDMQTDIFFLRGIYVTLKTILQSNTCPIYFYRFDFDGNCNGYKQVFNVTRKGTCHGDEIFYMFKSTLIAPTNINSVENKIIKRFVNMWCQFAQNKFNDTTWPNTDGKLLLNIGEHLRVVQFPESHRMSFWEHVDAMINF